MKSYWIYARLAGHTRWEFGISCTGANLAWQALLAVRARGMIARIVPAVTGIDPEVIHV